MRPGEGAGLKWEQVEWEYHVIDLTKTETDPRRVPLTPEEYNFLKEMHKAADPENPFVFMPNDGKKNMNCHPNISDGPLKMQ